ncbi:MAG: glycosyl transferase family 2 [Acidobacteria bacterium]|nr:glycosyl transferase family 2 [Acidobacteriota bacterium]
MSDDFIRELMNVGEVDILVAVPSYNDGQTIGKVVQALRAGLLTYFPRARSVIINADGGSRDGTQDLVRAASISDLSVSADVHALRTLHSISTQYEGGPASGVALHTIVAAADLLQAKACAVVSPESTTIEPEWVERLLRPVFEGKDLVLPVYRRHKFDGLLIRNLVYPIARALYASKIREPYPADFAFSGSTAGQFLAQSVWAQEEGRRGTELWLTLWAVVSRLKLVQAFLGTKARLENPRSDLVNAMRETAGVLFCSMDCYASFWRSPQETLEAPCVGCQPAVSLEPLRLNRKRLHQMFVFGISELEPVFLSILSSATHNELKRLAALSEETFVYPAELWARTVYEFSAAYHKAVIGRDHIVQALVPLFRGRAYTFLTETREASAEEVENNIESLCHTFEGEKPYLVEIWDERK